MSLALKRLIDTPGSDVGSELFHDHRSNRSDHNVYTFAKHVAHENFTGKKAQIRKYLLTTLTDKEAWLPDESIGGHRHAFEMNYGIEVYRANWMAHAAECVRDRIDYVSIFRSEQQRQKEMQEAMVVVHLTLELIGHLPIYAFAIPDYEHDPGNGVLFITGYVAVDGRNLYGWYEQEVKLG